MAFAQVAEIIATDANSSGTQIDVDLGSSIDAGDLLLVGVCQADTADSWPDTVSGWSRFVDATVFASGRHAWYKRIADGGEGSSVAVPLTSGVQQASGIFVRITDWYDDLDGVEAGGGDSAFSTTANPTSFAPSWGSDDNLWIAAMGADDDDGGLSGYPSGYSNNTLAMNTGTDSQQCRIAIATKESAASSEDPGAFTLPSIEQWSALVIAVRPGAGGGGGSAMPVLAGYHYRRRRSG